MVVPVRKWGGGPWSWRGVERSAGGLRRSKTIFPRLRHEKRGEIRV